MIVKELPEIIDYLNAKNIKKQYQKAKKFLEDGQLKVVNFKIRQPKKHRVYQFRINKKYRAFGTFRNTKKYGEVFVVFKISDHQDF